jgi:hypothetical protein
MSNSVTNHRPQRKQLADQLDRLDQILDGLAEGLNDAVADACREGARRAVQEAVVEIQTNPDRRATRTRRRGRQRGHRTVPSIQPSRSRTGRVGAAPRPAKLGGRRGTMR